MSQVYLRPHHALCIQFFEGKGYSEEFVSHMRAVIGALQSSDPAVMLCDGCDVLCEKCPHNLGGVCETDGKASAIDERTLALLGLRFGDTLRWHELSARAYDRIIGCSKLSGVCRGCQWLMICNR
ncbi:MAG: DUF1284 domain-containing protein [Ruminococcus sp.]|nr:DUF1284 domain-containing protein [Ruminococcus sp.]